MIVDSYRFLPRSFRPLYEGLGPYHGEEGPVWAPFEKRLAEARIALLSSAGVYVPSSQESFDTQREQEQPDWGDPSWRAIPAAAKLAFAHLHINDEDLLADPEIVLPAQMLAALQDEGVIGGTVAANVGVMGYQHRALRDWRDTTVPSIVTHLREQGADALILAPA